MMWFRHTRKKAMHKEDTRADLFVKTYGVSRSTARRLIATYDRDLATFLATKPTEEALAEWISDRASTDADKLHRKEKA